MTIYKQIPTKRKIFKSFYCNITQLSQRFDNFNSGDVGGANVLLSRVTLIVPARRPGWEEMENLGGNLREFEEI